MLEGSRIIELHETDRRLGTLLLSTASRSLLSWCRHNFAAAAALMMRTALFAGGGAPVRVCLLVGRLGVVV